MTVAAAGTRAPYAFAGPLKYRRRLLRGSLSIVQWSHFVPRYDAWFDGTWAKAWGEKNDVQVDGGPREHTQLPALAATEVKRQQRPRHLRLPLPAGGTTRTR